MTGFTRRAALSFAGVLGLSRRRPLRAAELGRANLLSAALSLGGEWGQSRPEDAQRVVARMREACLSGLRLLSDRQPQKLRVDDHPTGPPYVFLHRENPDTAIVIVDVPTRDWCKLAYQFGHELGHVLCNSWTWETKVPPPSQWLEESLVEAFSIHGLGLLADNWEQAPPFAGTGAFAAEIRKYRAVVVNQYAEGRGSEPGAVISGWFRANREVLNKAHGVAQSEGPAILALAALLDHDRTYIEDYGALNRWKGQSAVPLEEYLALWQASCAEIRAPGRLPGRLKEMLGLR